MRAKIGGATLIALASLICGRAAGEASADLTIDQQSFVSLAIRDDIRRPSNKHKFVRGTVVCLSTKIDEGQTTGDGEAVLRNLRIPPALFERLSTDGVKYVAGDECVVRENEKVRLAGPVPTPAVLLEIEISDSAPSFARVAVAVAAELCDSNCRLTDTYAARKTKHGWAIVHEGHIDE